MSFHGLPQRFVTQGDPYAAHCEAVAARRALQAKRERPERVIPSLEAALTARLMATPMRSEDAERVVRRNLREVPGGYAWRSDARLRLPSSTRLPEPAIRAILASVEAPTLLIAARPAPPYFTPAQRAERAACVRDLRIEEIDGGHHLHMERADVVGPMLRDFLLG
jgi:pimeloyl-ACP methyl ester carboxylesterase